ncbi:MAG: RagB/SusD family nutrient uptake outer membrane protein [Bacteroidetes bacterium]|nr:RagB/SusD family nutrient uptake outer membrane protein [Fibrella sp.]
MKTILLFFSTLCVAGLLVLTAGCGASFVDLTPQDVIPPVAGFYRTEADIRAAVLGTYGNLRGIYNNFWQYTELPSDNTRSFGESEVATGEFDRLTWRSTTGGVSTAWNDAYRTISNSNVILEKIGGIPMSDALKNQYTGEAKFLRALMYFNLVRLFGDVPLILTEITTEAEAYTFKRTATAAIYAQIEQDLLGIERQHQCCSRTPAVPDPLPGDLAEPGTRPESGVLTKLYCVSKILIVKLLVNY